MRRALLLACCSCFLASQAFAMAEPSPVQPMHHMSVTQAPPVKTEKAKENPPEQPETKKSEPVAPKALSPETALKKMDGLVEWPYYTDLMVSGNDTALEKVIHAVDIDPGSVPPKGLLYLAKALSDRKRYEEAAFYFYAGQLRATFDMARFPPYTYEDKEEASDKRTEDQKGEVPEAEAVVINPHESVAMLALTVGAPISKWAMTDPDRLDTVMDKVRAWDMATPYGYLPDYDISHAKPFESWPALLAKARNDYFIRVGQIANGLRKLRPDAPTPSFTAPQ